MALRDLTYYIYNTPFGQITIGSNGNSITELYLGPRALSGTYKPTRSTNVCSTEILEYLSGRRTTFDIEINPAGSAFQQEVWKALRSVNFGETITPRSLAKMIDKESSYRRIPLAAHNCPISIIIPNHRLVPASKFEKPDRGEKMRVALRNLEAKYLS